MKKAIALFSIFVLLLAACGTTTQSPENNSVIDQEENSIKGEEEADPIESLVLAQHQKEKEFVATDDWIETGSHDLLLSYPPEWSVQSNPQLDFFLQGPTTMLMIIEPVPTTEQEITLTLVESIIEVSAEMNSVVKMSPSVVEINGQDWYKTVYYDGTSGLIKTEFITIKDEFTHSFYYAMSPTSYKLHSDLFEQVAFTVRIVKGIPKGYHGTGEILFEGIRLPNPDNLPYKLEDITPSFLVYFNGNTDFKMQRVAGLGEQDAAALSSYALQMFTGRGSYDIHDSGGLELDGVTIYYAYGVATDDGISYGRVFANFCYNGKTYEILAHIKNLPEYSEGLQACMDFIGSMQFE